MESLSKGSAPLGKVPGRRVKCQTKVVNDHWTVPSVQQGQQKAFRTSQTEKSKCIVLHTCLQFLHGAGEVL